MNGSAILIQCLEREGTDVVFGYPGGAIMPVYDALYDAELKHVLVRHEQAAVLAADGYARATGKLGVCIATSGPGATNLVTGLANAFMDSVPLVAITGQVPTSLLGTDAFQEVDIFGITLPVVKHSFLVRRVEELAEVVHEAFRLARSKRPGPVLIDLPKDVASAPCDLELSELPPCDVTAPLSTDSLDEARSLLASAKRPILYAGGGIVLGRAVDAFRRFVEKTRIPVTTTLKGLGVLPTDHELFLGMLGMHGTKAANLAIRDCDLLVGVGVRFDDRATGKLSEFAPNAKVLHLDVDPAEVGKLRRPDVALVGSLEASLEALFEAGAASLDIVSWRRACARLKEEHRWDYDMPADGIYGPRFLKKLSEAADPGTIFACDVGQHQMWVAQHCCLGAQLAISVHNCPVLADTRFPMSIFKRTQRKYVKKAYRVRNWREYEAGLRNRGSLTVWISLTAGKLVNWDAPRPRRRKPGRQRKYSNHAIETAVTLGMVFHLSSRQSEGLLRSLFALMKLDNDVPDHTTISRRKAKLGKVPFYQDKQKTPLHILIDSSGLAVHAGQLRRAPNSRDYRKLHLCVDEQTGEVVAGELTSKRARDSSRVASLVRQSDSPISSARADTAYDASGVYEAIENHSAHRSPMVLIPPRKGALLASGPASSRQRNRNIAAQARLGKRKWHTESGYSKRSKVETTFHRYKAIVGSAMRARGLAAQRVEARIGCKILNTMTALGMPDSEMIG